jgi:hypothetical protein
MSSLLWTKSRCIQRTCSSLPSPMGWERVSMARVLGRLAPWSGYIMCSTPDWALRLSRRHKVNRSTGIRTRCRGDRLRHTQLLHRVISDVNDYGRGGMCRSGDSPNGRGSAPDWGEPCSVTRFHLAGTRMWPSETMLDAPFGVNVCAGMGSHGPKSSGPLRFIPMVTCSGF